MTQPLNLKQVINKLISEHAIDDAFLSRETGVPVSTIKRMRLDKTANPTRNTLVPIASYFKITIDQLLGLAPIDKLLHNKLPYRMIPVLSRGFIRGWLKGEIAQDLIAEWTKTSIQDPKCYAIKHKEFAKHVNFNKDSIAVIAPSINPSPGDSVIITNTLFNEPTLLDLHSQNGEYFVTLFDRTNDLIPLKLPFEFYGVVSEIFYHTKEEHASNLINEGVILAPFMLQCRG